MLTQPLLKTLPSRNGATQSWARALANIAPLRANKAVSLGCVIDALADRFGEAPALAAPDEALTYRRLRERKAQYAGWALQQGIPPGAVVGLLMENRPEYVAIWIGLTQAGVVVALINTNLTGGPLAHAIRAAGATHIIAGREFVAALHDAQSVISAHLQIWTLGEPDAAFPGVHVLDPAACTEAARGAPARAQPGDPALLIYTSGTTGLPKAARISHYRILEWSYWFAGMMNAGPSDRLYDCLPLYHSTGGVAAIGAMLVSGGQVEIRRRFSASRFWPDIAASGCTVFFYIGELCRYLLSAPAAPAEAEHSLRLCVGNGLSADVWPSFVNRFGMPQILEFYASTEGNVSLYNCEGRPGAIGRVPPFLAAAFPVALIACDDVTGEPLRGEDKFCIRCEPGTQGEAIGEILSEKATDPSSFDGYTDKAATDRKVLRNVFRDGDRWFRTGDLMVQDKDRFFYFVDRLGDTFRWKGENVSSTEVAQALCRCAGISGAAVYGVQVAGCDGRAGMAALTLNGPFNPRRLHSEIAALLPAYARPKFLRLCASLEITGTFKPIKTELAAQGFADAVYYDSVYIDDTGTYRRLGVDEAEDLRPVAWTVEGWGSEPLARVRRRGQG